jgi:hypothetical protein
MSRMPVWSSFEFQKYASARKNAITAMAIARHMTPAYDPGGKNWK